MSGATKNGVNSEVKLQKAGSLRVVGFPLSFSSCEVQVSINITLFNL